MTYKTYFTFLITFLSLSILSNKEVYSIEKKDLLNNKTNQLTKNLKDELFIKNVFLDSRNDSLEKLYYSEFSFGLGLGASYGFIGGRIQYRKYRYGFHTAMGMGFGKATFSCGAKFYPLKYLYVDLHVAPIGTATYHTDGKIIYGLFLMTGIDWTIKESFGINLGIGYGSDYNKLLESIGIDIGIYKSF